MVKYYLSYTEENAEAAMRADARLKELGARNTSDYFGDEKSALADADFLFVLPSDPGQLELPEIKRQWEYFDSEIRWKRKARGEIVFVVQNEDALKNLPVRLKKYGYYLTDEIDDLAAYCKDASEATDDGAEKSEGAVPEVKQIKYSPPEETVKQIEFSVRAPSVKSFDGSVSRQGERNNACKKDHVFDDLGDNVPQKQQVRQKRGGVAALVFVLIVLAVMAIAFLASGISSGAATASFGEIAPLFDTCASQAGAANALQPPAAYGII